MKHPQMHFVSCVKQCLAWRCQKESTECLAVGHFTIVILWGTWPFPPSLITVGLHLIALGQTSCKFFVQAHKFNSQHWVGLMIYRSTNLHITIRAIPRSTKQWISEAAKLLDIELLSMNDNSHIKYIIYLWVVAMARGRRQLSAVAISAMSGTCHRPVYRYLPCVHPDFLSL